jgi:hypothetical protein
MIKRTPARDRALSRFAADPAEWLDNAFRRVCNHDPEQLQALYDARTDAQIAADGFSDHAAYLSAVLPDTPEPFLIVPPIPAPGGQATNAWSAVRAELSDAENDALTVRLRGTGAANTRLQRLREDARDGFPVSRADIVDAMQAAGVITAERGEELA